MSRRRTGTVYWHATRNVWVAKLTMNDGHRTCVDLPYVKEGDRDAAMAACRILAERTYDARQQKEALRAPHNMTPSAMAEDIVRRLRRHVAVLRSLGWSDRQIWYWASGITTDTLPDVDHTGDDDSF